MNRLGNRTVRQTIAALGAVALLAACDVRVGDDGDLSFGVRDGRASDDWRGSYELVAGGVIEVANTNGRITVVRAEGQAVEVLAHREARASSDEAARALLEAVTIHEDVSPERVAIAARRTGASGDAREGPFGPRGLHIDYEVRVPAGVGASLRTENGEVRIEALEGHVSASTTNGNVFASGLSGSLEASTVNGSINADFDRVSADVRMSTVNGGIRVTLAPDVAGRIEASAVNGGVSVDESLAFEADTSDRRRTTGRLGGGGPSIVLQTTNGSVRVTGRD